MQCHHRLLPTQHKMNSSESLSGKALCDQPGGKQGEKKTGQRVKRSEQGKAQRLVKEVENTDSFVANATKSNNAMK